MFCVNCGRQIPENGICECERPVVEPAAAAVLAQAPEKSYPGQVIIQRILSKDSTVKIANKNIRYLHIAIASAALILILIIGFGVFGSNELVGTWVSTDSDTRGELTFKRNGKYSVIYEGSLIYPGSGLAEYGKYTVDEKNKAYIVTFESGTTQVFYYTLVGGNMLQLKDGETTFIKK